MADAERRIMTNIEIATAIRAAEDQLKETHGSESYITTKGLAEMLGRLLEPERAKVKLLVKRIRGALMHLNTNFDSDFVSMADSDAADELRKALRECGEGGE